MINLTQLALRRGPRILFQDVNLSFHARQKIGLIGANGVGKSSLFALIRGELHADAGDCVIPSSWVIAHVAQEIPSTQSPAIEFVLDGDAQLRALEKSIKQAESSGQGERLAQLFAEYEAIGGYTARARAATLLHGLGFSSAQETWTVDSFSGGWRMRLNLARALMCRSDLLLLDEPTNHLDLDAVVWLETWLNGYSGVLLLISHDREFLDNIVTHIAHIERQQINLYTGNYSAFEVLRAQQLANQKAAFEKQQREIEHVQAFVRRFRAKATKARQAQSRLKSLERMQLIAPAHVDSPFQFSFKQPEAMPNPLLGIENAAVGYQNNIILSGVNLQIVPGDRIGLLGPNGAGKSTLVKLLAGVLAPMDGACDRDAKLRVGYFAQHQLEQLDLHASALLHLQRIDPRAKEQDLRNFLGGFAFQGEMATNPIAPFSGGEKARLALALIVYQKPNLLLLDEPTNHLDLEMRHALTLALQDFQGAIVTVSHDRYFIRTVSDTLWLAANGQVNIYESDLEEYLQWLRTRKQDLPQTEKPDTAKGVAPASRKEQRQQSAEARKKSQPLRRQIDQLEKLMAQFSAQKQQLEAQLADSNLYQENNKDKLRSVLADQVRINQQLQETEEQWMLVQEQLEDMERS